MNKQIKVKKFDNNYFYKVINVFPEEFLPKLYESSVYWLESTRKEISEEVYPPEASSELLSYPEHIDSDIWITFYSEIKKHIAKYCSISEQNLDNIQLHSAWITRIEDIEFPGDHNKEALIKGLTHHSSFGNMHSHTGNPIGMVFYLKNPDPKYGTMVKLENNKIFQNNGEENSLLIFNPQLYHSGVYPKIEETQVHPRITIVADCSYKK